MCPEEKCSLVDAVHVVGGLHGLEHGRVPRGTTSTESVLQVVGVAAEVQRRCAHGETLERLLPDCKALPAEAELS